MTVIIIGLAVADDGQPHGAGGYSTHWMGMDGWIETATQEEEERRSPAYLNDTQSP